MNLSNYSGDLAPEKTSGFFILYLWALLAELIEALLRALAEDSCELLELVHVL